MKIIQIVGRANTGKTTFIKNLIPQLKKHGRTGVIKHLADHDYKLDPGKDTTQFFENGAEISAGIDPDKAVVTLHTNSLEDLLLFFKIKGLDFVILEGFKTWNFPKIVIGDLPSDSCILRNPTIEQVIVSLPLFEDY